VSASPAYHGGNLGAARALFPDAPSPWLDLSTGINAQAYPIGTISPEAWMRLPDAGAIAALEGAASRAYGGPVEKIVAAPGTQALIQALPRLLPARSVAILGFTYAEHERVWRESGAATRIVDDVAALAEAELAVVVNPNNPDGRLVPIEALIEIAAMMARNGGTLVVDEAFVDVLPSSSSLASRLPEAGAVILRSFGKTYGLAGLRLGFAVAAPDLAAKIRAALGSWAVGGPAITIAARALADDEWLSTMRGRLADEAPRLDGILTAAGWEVIGGTRLFRLARHADAGERFLALLEAGILTRPFADAPDRLRFGLPADERAWARLAEALGVRHGELQRSHPD
jgi:cobalamin biosynthetic protein CobC